MATKKMPLRGLPIMPVHWATIANKEAPANWGMNANAVIRTPKNTATKNPGLLVILSVKYPRGRNNPPVSILQQTSVNRKIYMH